MNKHIDALLKVSEEVSHAEASIPAKRKSLIECNATCVEWLLKMKHGAFSKVKLALDGADVSDCIFDFRLLTGQEDQDIDDEMAKTGLSSLDFRYLRKKIALTLSKASTPYASFKAHTQEFNSPQLSVADLFTIPSDMLFALGYKYDEFKKRCSPKLESLTQEQIDDCIKSLEECENDIKKFDLLNGWNLSATHEVIINLVSRLTKLTKQMEAAFIG